MFFKRDKKRIKELEEKMMALEIRVMALEDEKKHPQEEQGNEKQLTYKEIVDEWVNGKRS